MNPDQFFTPNELKVIIIRIENLIKIMWLQFDDYFFILKQSATILPPALLESVGIENYYGCYSGWWAFLGKSKLDSSVFINYAVEPYLLLPRKI